MPRGLDEALTDLDTALAAAERQAAAVLSTVKSLRKQPATGTVAGLPRRLEQLPAAAEPLAAALEAASAGFGWEGEGAPADRRVRQVPRPAAPGGGVGG